MKYRVGGTIIVNGKEEVIRKEFEAQNGWHAMVLFEKSLTPEQKVKAISAGKIREEAA